MPIERFGSNTPTYSNKGISNSNDLLIDLSNPNREMISVPFGNPNRHRTASMRVKVQRPSFSILRTRTPSVFNKKLDTT